MRGKKATKSAKKSVKKAKSSGKRGNPGYFSGGPLALLESFLPEYIAQRNNREEFWETFNGRWLTEYPPNLTTKERAKVALLIAKYSLDGNRRGGGQTALKSEDEASEKDEQDASQKDENKTAGKDGDETAGKDGDQTTAKEGDKATSPNGANNASTSATNAAETNQEAGAASNQTDAIPKIAEGNATSDANGVEDPPLEKSNEVGTNDDEGGENTGEKGKGKEREQEKDDQSEVEEEVTEKKHHSKRTEKENILLARAAGFSVSSLFYLFIKVRIFFCKSAGRLVYFYKSLQFLLQKFEIFTKIHILPL
jgi:hypothetical protein